MRLISPHCTPWLMWEPGTVSARSSNMRPVRGSSRFDCCSTASPRLASLIFRTSAKPTTSIFFLVIFDAVQNRDLLMDRERDGPRESAGGSREAGEGASLRIPDSTAIHCYIDSKVHSPMT